MVTTEQLAQGSLLFGVVGYIIALAMSLYSLWLNREQAKVKNQMGLLIEETRQIRRLLVIIMNRKN